MKSKVDVKQKLSNFTPEAITGAAVKLVQQTSSDWKGSIMPKPVTESDDGVAADELMNYALRVDGWYRKWAVPIIKTLKAKQEKGQYSKAQAVKLWLRAAVGAADLYAKANGPKGAKGKDMFMPNQIKLAAGGLEAHYGEEILKAK